MRARASRVVGAIVLGLALVGGCKSTMTADHVEVADDIDAIERALAERGAELEQEGVVVAYRDAREPTPAVPGGDEELGEPGPPAAGPDVGPVTPTPPPPTTTDAPLDLRQTTPSEAGSADALERTSKTAGAQRESVSESRRAKRLGARRAADEEVSRCERLWGLAESTCGLRTRVCALSGRHPGDIRYAVACRRAEDQCAAARELCASCPS